MTTEELAQQVLSVLALQASYFKDKNPMSLQRCKEEERRLKKTCQEILTPTEPKLFE